MELPGSKLSEGLFEIARIEDQLASVLNEAAGDVARSECFDAEQRAEVYAILDCMRSDTAAHRQAVGLWANDRTGEVHNV